MVDKKSTPTQQRTCYKTNRTCIRVKLQQIPIADEVKCYAKFVNNSISIHLSKRSMNLKMFLHDFKLYLCAFTKKKIPLLSFLSKNTQKLNSKSYKKYI